MMDIITSALPYLLALVAAILLGIGLAYEFAGDALPGLLEPIGRHAWKLMTFVGGLATAIFLGSRQEPDPADKTDNQVPGTDVDPATDADDHAEEVRETTEDEKNPSDQELVEDLNEL